MGGRGSGKGEGGASQIKKAKEVYALRFVGTSSPPTCSEV